MTARSSGSRPPQIPHGSPLARADVRHGVRTGHSAHTVRQSSACAGVGSIHSRSRRPRQAAWRDQPALVRIETSWGDFVVLTAMHRSAHAPFQYAAGTALLILFRTVH